MEGTLSSYPKEVVGSAIAALEKYGIINPVLVIAILSTISKESGFKPKSETSYAGTNNARIRQIFGKRVGSLSEDQLTKLKADPTAFFDHIYNGRYGNVAKGDGYKYRGRGLNQITFKGNYKAVGDIIGIDLVNNPDKLNDPIIASAAAAAYFIMFFKTGKTSGKLKERLGVNDVSEIKDPAMAVKAVIMANAGWGTDFSAPVVQEGYKKALSVYQEFAKSFSSIVNSAAKVVKENKGTVGAALFFLGL
ncbi:MAG TPA: glycoside hydrolase family 19 protein [Bacteroidia bacterium]|jgi:predicted chitinase